MLAKQWSCIKVQAGLTVISQPISPNANNWHALGSLTALERIICLKVLKGGCGDISLSKIYIADFGIPNKALRACNLHKKAF